MKVIGCWAGIFVIKYCFVLDVALGAHVFIIDFHNFY